VGGRVPVVCRASVASSDVQLFVPGQSMCALAWHGIF
jgi:hypothetical protein